MGKTFETVKFWNLSDEDRVRSGQVQPLALRAQIDSGAITVVLPEATARQLGLRTLERKKVRYADMRVEEREIVGGLRVEIQGRTTECWAIVEPARTTPLVGQLVLEGLDLWIDSKQGRLVPNPDNPDAPIMDVLLLRLPHSRPPLPVGHQ